ncbi:uncharacterized protein VTP21DRAFT_6277 [Calcarisporiella thermophila]|uniref:uncharacterized protein n=1 Tax=Calcarisporiella thermophila TaxID=911321 RepID=UPI0037449E4F
MGSKATFPRDPTPIWMRVRSKTRGFLLIDDIHRTLAFVSIFPQSRYLARLGHGVSLGGNISWERRHTTHLWPRGGHWVLHCLPLVIDLKQVSLGYSSSQKSGFQQCIGRNGGSSSSSPSRLALHRVNTLINLQYHHVEENHGERRKSSLVMCVGTPWESD